MTGLPRHTRINLGRIYASLCRLSRLDKVTITAINGLASKTPSGPFPRLGSQARIPSSAPKIGLIGI